MTGIIRNLAWIEFKTYLRNRTALFWTFVNPLVTMVVLMAIFGSNDSGIQLGVDVRIEASSPADDAYAEAIVERISDSGFLDVKLRDDPPENRSALGAIFKVENPDGGRRLDIEQLYGEANHFAILTTAVRAAIADEEAAGGTADERWAMAAIPTQRTEQNSYGEYLTVGILALTVISVCLFGLSVPLVEMRNSGAGRMYQIFPMSPGTFMASYILSRVFIIVLLGVTIVVFADIVYGLSFDLLDFGFLSRVLIVCLFSAIAFISMGMMIAGVSKSVAVANALVNLLYLPIMMFSDIFLPIGMFPEYLADILRLQPISQFVNGARVILIDGASILSQWPAFVSLAALSAVCLAVALKTFTWRET